MTDDIKTPTPKPASPHIDTAAEVAAKCISAFDRKMSPESMRDALSQMMSADAKGEAALMLQAQVLDAMFHRLAGRALTPLNPHIDDTRPPYLNCDIVQIAMRAQHQCRNTYESLRRIRDTDRDAKEIFTNKLKDTENNNDFKSLQDKFE